MLSASRNRKRTTANVLSTLVIAMDKTCGTNSPLGRQKMLWVRKWKQTKQPKMCACRRGEVHGPKGQFSLKNDCKSTPLLRPAHHGVYQEPSLLAAACSWDGYLANPGYRTAMSTPCAKVNLGSFGHLRQLHGGEGRIGEVVITTELFNVFNSRCKSHSSFPDQNQARHIFF